MVFTSIVQLVRSRGPDQFWRKRRIFRLAAHFIGRRRNCYSIAVRYVHRALVYATKGRSLRREDARDLWQTRIKAAAAERGCGTWELKEGLDRAGVMLNKKTLAELAIWEPRTFDSITALALHKAEIDNIKEQFEANHISKKIDFPVLLGDLLKDKK